MAKNNLSDLSYLILFKVDMFLDNLLWSAVASPAAYKGQFIRKQAEGICRRVCCLLFPNRLLVKY